MFKTKPKSENPLSSIGGNTLIGVGTTIRGDLVSTGDIRVDGTVLGNIAGTAKVVIGGSGVVHGDIEALQADIQGKVNGKIQVKEILNLRGEAIIEGDIYAGKLQIEPQVTFNGHCHMGQDVYLVDMSKEEKRHAIAQ